MQQVQERTRSDPERRSTHRALARDEDGKRGIPSTRRLDDGPGEGRHQQRERGGVNRPVQSPFGGLYAPVAGNQGVFNGILDLRKTPSLGDLSRRGLFEQIFHDIRGRHAGQGEGDPHEGDSE